MIVRTTGEAQSGISDLCPMRWRYGGAVVATTGNRRHSGASAGFGAVAEIASHGAASASMTWTAQNHNSRPRAMISFWISVVPPKIETSLNPGRANDSSAQSLHGRCPCPFAVPPLGRCPDRPVMGVNLLAIRWPGAFVAV